MILDKIENAENYYSFSNNLKKGFEFIQNTNLKSLPVGKHEVSGDEVFALVSEYESKPHADCKPESHKIYADIQFIVSGKEFIGYVPLNGQIETIPYIQEKDIAFFNEETTQLLLQEGMFAVFFPQDIHRPCMQIDGSEKVKKVVVKVKL